MKLEHLQNGVYGITFSTSFTLEDIPLFTALTVSLEKKQFISVVMDMLQIDLIDSTGIKHLDKFIHKMREQNKAVSIVNVPPRIKEILIYKGIRVNL